MSRFNNFNCLLKDVTRRRHFKASEELKRDAISLLLCSTRNNSKLAFLDGARERLSAEVHILKTIYAEIGRKFWSIEPHCMLQS